MAKYANENIIISGSMFSTGSQAGEGSTGNVLGVNFHWKGANPYPEIELIDYIINSITRVINYFTLGGRS